jgi:hypothetical protein
MKMKLFLVLMTAIMFNTPLLKAQKTFDELAAGKNLATKELHRPKYYKLDMRSDGGGIFAYYPAIPTLKKIAIVSTFVNDVRHYKVSTNRSYMTGGSYIYKTTTTSTSSTSTESDLLLESEALFYFKGLPAMKELAKSRGIELLEIKDALNTPELKEYYENFVPEASKFGEKMAKMGKKLEDKSKGEADGDMIIRPGYNVYDRVVFTDYKFGTSMGQLCKKLGVDAVMVFVNEVSSTKKTLNLMMTGVYIFGPNPVPMDPNKKYGGFGGAKYNEGHLWWGIEMGCGKNLEDGFPYFNYKENKANIEGYEKIPSNCLATILDKIEATKNAYKKDK